MIGECIDWLTDKLLFYHCSRNKIDDTEDVFVGLHAIRYLTEKQYQEVGDIQKILMEAFDRKARKHS